MKLPFSPGFARHRWVSVDYRAALLISTNRWGIGFALGRNGVLRFLLGPWHLCLHLWEDK